MRWEKPAPGSCTQLPKGCACHASHSGCRRGVYPIVPSRSELRLCALGDSGADAPSVVPFSADPLCEPAALEWSEIS